MLHHLVLATRRLAPLLLTAALGACGSAPSLAPPITADPQAPKAGATFTDEGCCCSFSHGALVESVGQWVARAGQALDAA